MPASIPKFIAGAATAILSDIPFFAQAHAIRHSRGSDMDIPQTGTTVFPKGRSRPSDDTAAIGTDLAGSLPFTAFWIMGCISPLVLRHQKPRAFLARPRG